MVFQLEGFLYMQAVGELSAGGSEDRQGDYLAAETTEHDVHS